MGLFLKTTGHNFFYDNGFFLAMGLAFNLLLYCTPARPAADLNGRIYLPRFGTGND